MKQKKTSLNPFSEPVLVVLISVVTLLLQLISFATTWNGSKVYLEDIFPYASLLFAIAIQATAYFLSNSLRTRAGFLKVAALLVALCCSTYYSYIGIYNSVNSPAGYLQETYVCITDELTQLYTGSLNENTESARDSINEAVSVIYARYSLLAGKQAAIDECHAALSEITTAYTEQLRAPKQSAYENYEDYVAAYKAYIAGISDGANTEKDSARTGILASYGFSSVEALNDASLTAGTELSALTATGITPDTIADIHTGLTAAIEASLQGTAFSSHTTALLSKLAQAATLCGYDGLDAVSVKNTADLCAAASAAPLCAEYTALVARLPEGQSNAANIMALKTSMDAELLHAILTLNSLLPEAEKLSLTDPAFMITDLYLLPIKALQDTATRLTAFFCLAVAALIDMLSVLFAVSVKKAKPLWGKRTLFAAGFREYAPQIFACLPASDAPAIPLYDFLHRFKPSPQTESDGYMMCTPMEQLTDYLPLCALLCQINLAKVIQNGGEDGSDILLLKARFVFWANELIYKETEVFA